MSRVLIPLFYTTGDRFHHDLAIPVPPLAGLQRARELSGLDPSSDGYRFATAALLRERNRVVHALEAAAGIMDAFAPSQARGRRVPSAAGARRAGRAERRQIDE